MFLTPETEFAITVRTTTKESNGVEVPSFKIEEGGSLKLRTATGREYQKLLMSLRDPDSMFDLLPRFVVSGLDVKRIESLHPAVVHTLIQEVITRSRLDEASRGN